MTAVALMPEGSPLTGTVTVHGNFLETVVGDFNGHQIKDYGVQGNGLLAW